MPRPKTPHILFTFLSTLQLEGSIEQATMQFSEPSVAEVTIEFTESEFDVFIDGELTDENEEFVIIAEDAVELTTAFTIEPNPGESWDIRMETEYSEICPNTTMYCTLLLFLGTTEVTITATAPSGVEQKELRKIKIGSEPTPTP